MVDLEKKVADAEDDYASSEDEDFNPTTAEVDEEDVSSSSDDDDINDASRKARKATKKRKQADDGDLDSGDEATIKELRRKKKRKGDADEDSGGEGGLVKTRAQRAAEYVMEYSEATRGIANGSQGAGETRVQESEQRGCNGGCRRAVG